MKRVVGLVLVGLGAFLLVLAPLAKWYVAPQLAVAPLGCDPGPLCEGGVSISPSSGVATVLFDPATLTPRANVDLLSTRRVKPDQAASDGPNNQTVYDSFQDVTDPEGVTVDASTERIAFDGHTSEMINCCGANEDGTPITDFSGIAPYKFPFGTQKQTYQYFDGTLSKALPMEYETTEEILGLEVYKFVQTIPPTQYSELEVPGDLVGQAGRRPRSWRPALLSERAHGLGGARDRSDRQGPGGPEAVPRRSRRHHGGDGHHRRHAAVHRREHG